MLKTLFSLFFITILLTACENPSNTNLKKTKILLLGKTMGTTYHITIVNDKNLIIDTKKLQLNIDNLLEKLNQTLSTYIPHSQISKFNKSHSTDWIKVNSDFFTIVEAAQKVSKDSDGSFDISISPLIEEWGFGVKKQNEVPIESSIQKAMTQIGYQLLELNPEQQSLRKINSKLHIDLSAIAKGYAVDKISEFLIEKNFSEHLVEVGGELRTSGFNQEGKKWRIAIEQPDLITTKAQQGLEITNRSIATSGDYRNFFIEKGIKRSHIINPKTGYPIKHNLVSVTVLHQSTMLADAYATALMVMGETKGKIFAEENNLDILMIVREGEKFKFWSSSKLFL